MHHVRAAGMCGPGLRLWAAYAQVDLRTFCREGLLIEDYPHLIDDPFVVRALAAALEEETHRE